MKYRALLSWIGIMVALSACSGRATTISAGTDSLKTPTSMAPAAMLKLVSSPQSKRIESLFSLPTGGGVHAPYQIAVSDSAKVLAVQYFDQSVVLWSLDSSKPITRLIGGGAGSSAPIGDLALSPDGTLVAWTDSILTYIWNSKTNDISSIDATIDSPTILKFSPDGKRLLYAGFGVGIYDISSKQSTAVQIADGVAANYSGPITKPIDARFSADGTKVVVAGLSYFATLTLGDRAPIVTFCGCQAESSAISPDSSHVAFISTHKVFLWDTGTRKESFVFSVSNLSVSGAYSRDGATLLVGGSVPNAVHSAPAVELLNIAKSENDGPLDYPTGRGGYVDRIISDVSDLLFVMTADGPPETRKFFVFGLG